MAITDEELAIAKDIAKDKKRPVFFYWNDGVPCCPICHEPLTKADKCQTCGVILAKDASLSRYCQLINSPQAKAIAKGKNKKIPAYWVDGKPYCPICHESLTQADKCQTCNAELIHDESLDHYCELLHG